MELLSAYQQLHPDNYQGMSSAETKQFNDSKDFQSSLLWSRAEKFVRQELLIQIYMYDMLDTYTRIQISNCTEDAQKIISTLYSSSCYGKEAAKEAANLMEKKYVEKLLAFLKISCKENPSQLPLAEIQTQLKEEHCALTEKLLQEKYTSSLQDMANYPEMMPNMDYAVYFVLSQRHLRQMVILLQEQYKVQDQEKLLKKWNVHESNNANHSQEDVLNLLTSQGEASKLLRDLQHLIKRIQIRENFLKELGTWLKEYCPDKVSVLAYLEEVHCLESDLQNFVGQQLKNLKTELKILFESIQVTEQSKTVASEQREDIVVDEKELYSCPHGNQIEVEHSHRKKITEERLKLQDLLERGELSGFLKQKLIKEHDETISFLEKALQQNLDMVDMDLKSKTKTEKKEKPTQPDPDPTHGRSNLQDVDHKLLSMLADKICIFQQAEQIAAARISRLGPLLYSTAIPGGTDLRTSSPLLTLLKEVDCHLRTRAQNAKVIKCNNISDQTHTFRDVQDLQLNCDETLTLVHYEDLSPREFVVYQYGIDILHFLKSYIDIGDLKLLVASALPKNEYQGNAFVHSFLYQKSENKLYVSRDYLQSVGSLILLLIHCTSHIISGGFSDDNNPIFLRTFYQTIKACLNEGFLSKFELLSQSKSSNSHRTSDGTMLQAQQHATEHRDFISMLMSAKCKTSKEKSYSKEREEMSSLHETATMLKDQVFERKREFFTKDFEETSCKRNKEENSQEIKTTEHLLKTLDKMNMQLMGILEKEIELKKNNVKDVEEGRYYFKLVSLEKERLMKEIETLEDQITISAGQP